MGLEALQTRLAASSVRVERVLEAERHQLVLWTPVALGAGIAAWFALRDAKSWTAFIIAALGLGLSGVAAAGEGRLRHVLLLAGLLAALGCGLAWWRAERVAAPVLARPVVALVMGEVERVELLPAKQAVRVTIAAAAPMPPRVRVSIPGEDAPALAPGDVVRVRARLVPPQGPAVPGGYDFARAAWFGGLGGVGKALGPVEVVRRSERGQALRERLSAHIRARVEGSAGGIASAFATGDRGGIDEADEEAMRASGLTHLLSVSGLHVSAVAGAAMLLTLRLLALSPWLALRTPLVLISAAVAGAAALGYTVLTGSEVPTIRSCVAVLLVLLGIAIGREAFTLRLVAAGAVFVLLIWPESLIGPSFQLSFAAITAIVALHEHPRVRGWFAKRDEGQVMRLLRGLASLLLTGLAVEAALAPIALFHFHKQGLYGALANIVAIPLTTFVTMPLEALALLFDTVGLGAPFWWGTAKSLELLLWLAHATAGMPGAQAVFPDVPTPAFTLMIGGGLWLLLWTTAARWLGLVPLAVGIVLAGSKPAPDLLITSDGKHLALRLDDDSYATLRSRAGDYVRDVLAERGGTLDDLSDLDQVDGANCTTDLCRVVIERGGRRWTLLATRSPYFVDYHAFRRACAQADLVVSDRRLPPWCRPRWLKADAALLKRTGGLALTFAPLSVETARRPGDRHPWVSSGAAGPRAAPARERDRRGSAAAHTPNSRGRDGPLILPRGNI